MNRDANTSRDGGSDINWTINRPMPDQGRKEGEPNMATTVSDPSSGSIASRVWHLLSRKRIHISLVVICALIAEDMIRGQHPHAVINFSDAWSTVGLLLVLAGTLLRSWGAGFLAKNSVLSTSGPYAITRNPLYLGSFLMMLGFCTLIGALHNYVAMTLLAVLLYWPKIKNEEASLQGRFGQEWTDYVRAAPRLLPRRLLVRGAWAGWSFAQWWRNKEYMAVLGAALGLAVFESWFLLVR